MSTRDSSKDQDQRSKNDPHRSDPQQQARKAPPKGQQQQAQMPGQAHRTGQPQQGGQHSERRDDRQR